MREQGLKKESIFKNYNIITCDIITAHVTVLDWQSQSSIIDVHYFLP